MKVVANTVEQLQILLEVVKVVQEMRAQQIDWVAVAADDRKVMMEIEGRYQDEQEDGIC